MHFAKMDLVNGRLVEISSVELPQSTIRACPHRIFDPSHYRADGTCKCDDRAAKEMRAWGYRWSAAKGLWM
jgi:hypothetical protein